MERLIVFTLIDLERRAPGGREKEAEGICEVGAVELRLVEGLVEARCDVVGREDVCAVGVRRKQERKASTITFGFLLLSETYVYLLQMSVTGKSSHNMILRTGKSFENGDEGEQMGMRMLPCTDTSMANDGMSNGYWMVRTGGTGGVGGVVEIGDRGFSG